MGATRLDYGVSELTSEYTYECCSFSYGNYSNIRDDKFNEIYRLLSLMGKVTIEDNFIGARYSKLLINSAFSGISTVCGDTFGAVSKNKESRKVIQCFLKECIDLSNVMKVKIEKIQNKDVVKLVDYHSSFKKAILFMIIPLAMKKHKDLKASMLQDIEKKIPTEIDSINGIVSSLGKKHNFKTPYNDKVVEIVKKIEKGELKPSFENIKLFGDIK